MSNEEKSQDNLSESFEEIYDLISIPKSNLNHIFSPQDVSDKDFFLNLKKQADEGDLNAQFEVGNCYEEGKGVNRSYKSAFYYYKLAADQGYRGAQLSLGMLYEEGIGCTKDHEKAIYYYELAAKQQSSIALLYLGDLYAEKLPEKAFFYYQRAAEAETENGRVYSRLAEAYQKGLGTNTSPELAEFYYRKAFDSYKKKADEGDVAAQLTLADYFEKGLGIKQSYEQAFYYYKLAAEQGHALSLHCLALCFDLGRGVEQSLEQAIYYYKLAIKRGYNLAAYNLARLLLRHQIQEEKAVEYLKFVVQKGCESNLDTLALSEYELGSCFEKGTGIKKSAQNALHYYRLAAEHGSKFAQHRLGQAYSKGELGLKKSFKKAVEYYELAASQQYSASLSALGNCYEKGIGVSKSPQNALYYCRLAAGHGSELAQYRLGNAYLKGELGLKKSFQKAVAYYRLAAAQQYFPALAALGNCYENGQGVVKSLEQAFHYYSLAAQIGKEEGDSYSPYLLAKCYEIGIGTQKDLNKAAYYYQWVGENGFDWGYYKAGSCLKKLGGEENARQAVAYFKKGAAKNELECIKALAEAFETGAGVEKSLSKALFYYKLAYENGSIVSSHAYLRLLAAQQNNEAKAYISESNRKLKERIQRKRSAQNTIVHPEAKRLDIAEYVKEKKIEILANLFKKSKDIPIYLEGHQLNEDEVQVIREAMIENPRFTFICKEEDLQLLCRAFEEKGYHPKDCLRCVKLLDGNWYGLLFLRQAA